MVNLEERSWSSIRKQKQILLLELGTCGNFNLLETTPAIMKVIGSILVNILPTIVFGENIYFVIPQRCPLASYKEKISVWLRSLLEDNIKESKGKNLISTYYNPEFPHLINLFKRDSLLIFSSSFDRLFWPVFILHISGLTALCYILQWWDKEINIILKVFKSLSRDLIPFPLINYESSMSVGVGVHSRQL